ncbi:MULTISPECIES: hypothetical protein [Haloferax]|uniref:DUF7282 domain-containing protein n=1 Tax=Haloferax marinum TaxID=2666143 RepID=A0A6A8G9D6_9EURY|nr:MULTISPECIES: hypothetical protein [Haloferax]KAB1198406.1 hypothetical protein Hfx1150_13135 [Haloferax sp. CBA1150]MRW97507.1 hypothetical protein [Haloferax marinum]
MKLRPQIVGVVVVAALITVAATGIGFAAPTNNTQASTGPTETFQQQRAQLQVQNQQCTYPANETYESFDVSNLSAPPAVEPGETVTVTADVSNPNDAPLIQCVEFRLEGDVVERRGWALNPGETETITFEVDTSGLAEGTYIHGVETRDMGELATLSVSSEPTETPTEEPTASVEFNDQTSNGSAVIVSNASLSEGGFVAIHDESGAVVGASDYLEPGAHERIVVTLSESLTANATLTAMPHLDTNDNQQLDFITSDGAEDGPYTENGTPVTDDADVTVETEPTETPTATPTETPTATPTETPSDEPTASVVFDDQASDGTTVTVASVDPSKGGFLVIHAENGDVLGVSEYLGGGPHFNVEVTLSDNLGENTTLTAMPHLDTNDNRRFDFVTSDGADDGPYTEDGDPVTDDANVTVGTTEPTETPTATPTETPTEEPTASVQFDDQSTAGIAVLVASANLSEGGFLVVHDESGAVLGASGYLPPGEQQNVAVTFDEPLSENATLTAMPHLDTNDNQQFDFDGSGSSEDGPYTEDGDPVTDDANVTVETAPGVTQ